mgnify:CR=1 FL=1
MLVPERVEYTGLFPISILFHHLSLRNRSLSLEIVTSDLLNAAPSSQIISLASISKITWADRGGSFANMQIWSSLKSLISKEEITHVLINDSEIKRSIVVRGE